MRVAAVLVLVVASGPARAQDAGPDEPRLTEQPAAERPRAWTLVLGARVFVRDTVSRVDVGDAVWRHERAIDEARVAATYDRKRLRIALEIDFAGGEADLKDTIIRVEPMGGLRLQAGRFKVPMSMFGLESKWRLPSIDRGILGELDPEDRDLPFTGERAEGLPLQLRPQLPLDPRLTAAIFQSPLAGGLAPIDPSRDVTQDLYLRAELEPLAGCHLAAAFALVGYQEQAGVADSLHHLALASLELHLDARRLHAWVEGFAGESFFRQPNGRFLGAFIAARALVGPRWRQPLAGISRLEPYIGASLLDPTRDRTGDGVSEIVAGVNVAFSRHWRLQLELAQRTAEGTASPVADTTLVRIQLGATFSETLQ